MDKEFWLKVVILVVAVWFVVNHMGPKQQVKTCFTQETVDGVLVSKWSNCEDL